MKALVLEKKGQFPILKDFDLTGPSSNSKVRLKASALNHRDVWIMKGLYPGINYPVIPGSDGAGELDGKQVLINPSKQWGPNEKYQATDYNILGMPANGTFSKDLIIEPEYIHPLPDHLSFTEGAALPLAGLTAYRALFKKGIPVSGERVFINGIGGGVALFAMQFALAKGLEVYVSSGSDDKITKAIGIGARGGINYKEESWGKKLLSESNSGFDIIVDGAGGTGFSELVKIANPGARIVIYGGTMGKITDMNTQQLFWKQISILGTTMGSDNDFMEMLKFVSFHKIIPIIDAIYKLNEAEKAFRRLDDGLQFGKIVFQHD